jgi:hypothetical protein
MIRDTTVDFIVSVKGGYLCKDKIAKKWRVNHLNATSFNTRKDAENIVKVMKLKDSRILKRMCVIED